ncbi:helicase-related protein [Methanobacterium sp. BAmetb5]|uniref:helicase-related protein n=1 Tax=Methanobacterium sp. BAmetb5 TaxID=2025351 RepID=UPI000E9E104F|nr:helicase-related protein [Methanobacterium sp. BAmetb5]AXV39096.1 MAG: helicase [Methanobacterium sp. BAmetb5]
MIKEGSILEGPYWPEAIEVKIIEDFGDHVHIIGTTINSGDTVDHLLTKAEFEDLNDSDGETGTGREILLDFSAPASEVFLSLEALKYKFASMFDPFLAMNTSKIDPLPFQLDAVYLHVLKNPKIRFMIADDPGAGKTIMAGLIIKELKLRGLARRILIVSPGHLKYQWQRELKDKFQENFTLVDRTFINLFQSENAWEVENQLITSIDFAKQDDIIESLNPVHWDLVVVDEAHKMAAYRYGKKITKRKGYKLGEVFSRTAENLLFLTATPHKGDPENYRLLLDLLAPGFFADQKMLTEARKKGENPLFLRRIKEDLRDFEGKPIFTKRSTQTVSFNLSDEEMELYEKLSKYVMYQFNKAIDQERRSFVFALLLLQRRMASSIYALQKSLKRKKEKFEYILENPDLLNQYTSTRFNRREDESEDIRWKEEQKWELATLSLNLEELSEEIKTLSELIEMSETILVSGNETKIEKLKSVMESLGDEKILIFSESKDTVDYLIDTITSWGYSVNTIHGEMNMYQRIEAEKVFKEKTQVMVATEAAGEGINLQFCHLMINYDIPWNPNRLEQRMGRIHRYKQKEDVNIFNLVAKNTREGKVLARILEKLEEIRNSIGTDKVFDVIGDVFQGKDLYQMVSDAVSGKRSVDDIEKDIDIPLDEDYKNTLIKELVDEGLVDSIDYKSIKELEELTQESRLVPEYLEEFFKKAFKKVGGKFTTRKNGTLNIASLPADIRRAADNTDFKKSFGRLNKSYPRLTFDKNFASENSDYDFLSFGHPLLEAVLKWVELNYSNTLQRGCVFRDPNNKFEGLFWFFEGTVNDGKGETVGKKLFALYESGEKLEDINPSIIWDLEPIDDSKPFKHNFDKTKAQSHAIKIIEEYSNNLKAERKRQSGIRRKYGIKSLEFFISELDADLTSLYFRQSMGENVDLAIHNKEEKKKNYEIALNKLKEDIIKEESVSMSMPKFIGAIKVIQDEDWDNLEGISTKEKLEAEFNVELIGMDVTMEFEKEQGRIPEDVSKLNLGFDIRSRSEEGELRYIEVKARSEEGLVKLTLNEWFKAKRFRENYWLYVVANATTTPTLYVIQDPVFNLKAEKQFDVSLVVYPDEWKKGEKVYEKVD